jgi:CubicO group peptidase (beta-lactamase class C family)
MSLKTNLLALAFLYFAIRTHAQDKPTQIARLMQTYHDYNMFNGAVLVADSGKILYKGAFGMANQEWAIANTTESKFMIGSISKPQIF